ncbi:MAG: hypothetical protein LUE29_08490 [Lachnospiraceae bacterium]|nr:hypothetical protein [Lachnospiraceae bacterium]
MLSLNIDRTRHYYEQIDSSDICDCAYCQNYVREIKSTYPNVAEYLFSFGVDIEKPFETMPLEPDENGYIEYAGPQYVVCGEPDDFAKTDIGSVTVEIAESHPSTDMNEPHFIIEIYPVLLKWVM